MGTAAGSVAGSMDVISGGDTADSAASSADAMHAGTRADKAAGCMGNPATSTRSGAHSTANVNAKADARIAAGTLLTLKLVLQLVSWLVPIKAASHCFGRQC